MAQYLAYPTGEKGGGTVTLGDFTATTRTAGTGVFASTSYPGKTTTGSIIATTSYSYVNGSVVSPSCSLSTISTTGFATLGGSSTSVTFTMYGTAVTITPTQARMMPYTTYFLEGNEVTEDEFFKEVADFWNMDVEEAITLFNKEDPS